MSPFSMRQIGYLTASMLLLSLPVYRVLSLDIGFAFISVVDALIVLGGFSLSFLMVYRLRMSRLPTSFYAGFGLLVVGCGISFLASHDVLGSTHVMLSILLKFVLVILLVEVIKDINDIKNFISLYIIACLIIAIVAIWQQLANLLGDNGLLSVSGTFAGRNEMLFYLVPGFLLSTGGVLWSQNRSAVLWYSVSSAILITAIFLSRGRAGMVISFVMFASIFILAPSMARRRLLRKVGLAVGFLLIMLSTLLTLVGKGSELSERYDIRLVSEQMYTERSSVFMRVRVLEGAFRAWQEAPFTGIGLGAFKPRSTEFVYLGKDVSRRIEVHNTYVSLLVEAGPLALAGFLIMLTSGFGVYKRRLNINLEAGLIHLALGASLGAISLHMVFMDSLTRYPLWIILGLCLAHIKVSRAGQRS